MYHTPNLTGTRKKVLPKRINEGWGLQHMKLYGIDDEIIMSGANLSDDYFTNRQDRYHVFNSKQVTDYFAKLYQAMCDLSYRVLPSEGASGFVLAGGACRGGGTAPDAPGWPVRRRWGAIGGARLEAGLGAGTALAGLRSRVGGF